MAKGYPLHRIQRAFRSIFRHASWRIGVIEKPIQEVLFSAGIDSHSIYWCPIRSQQYFSCDPFGMVNANEELIFFEEFDWKAGKGHIANMQYLGKGQFGPPTIALEMPFHLSFPNVIQSGDVTYLIPESYQENRLAAYTQEKNSGKWIKTLELISGRPLLDAAIVNYEGNWWLFATDFNEGKCEHLYLWHTENLTHPWQMHTKAPFFVGSVGARSAGNPIFLDGELFRIGQDCERTYGEAVVVFKIQELNQYQYREERVHRLEAPTMGPYGKGIHTISPLGSNKTLIDARAWMFSRHAFGRESVRLWKKLIQESI